jgi:hypothetical protein
LLVAKQPPRFGQNPPVKVVKVMSAYFQQNFSQFDFSVCSVILDSYVERLLKAKTKITLSQFGFIIKRLWLHYYSSLFLREKPNSEV